MRKLLTIRRMMAATSLGAGLLMLRRSKSPEMKDLRAGRRDKPQFPDMFESGRGMRGNWSEQGRS